MEAIQLEKLSWRTASVVILFIHYMPRMTWRGTFILYVGILCSYPFHIPYALKDLERNLDTLFLHKTKD